MRLLLKLKALKDFAYDEKYHHKIQGFIYRLTQGTPYEFLHSKKKYKFFCFSNIFPLKIGKNKKVCPFRRGDIKYLLISSPDAGFIKTLHKKLEEKIANNDEIKFGEMLFGLEGMKMLNTPIIKKKGVVIRTETPIVLRIPRRIYKKFKVNPPKPYTYIFWRKEYPIELFFEGLTKNLLGKYREFHKIDKEKFASFEKEVLPLFQRVKFIKTVSNKVIINGKEQLVIGLLFDFYFDFLNEKQRKILKFAVDAGFGERNSYGFGFVNVK
ncbi:CRISPR-associated endoribonuclease Cas6 [Candidatus Woesearchaeota archaeon]|nr:MAG: CRISPR-associated endoribonuclease Cas6 [Candidatus Woesearchaeota archaeon]